MRIRQTFDEVAMRGTKSVKCSDGCGKTLRRAKRFFQTLNPWNVDKQGFPKDRIQITRELFAEIRAWQKEPETCNDCATRIIR